MSKKHFIAFALIACNLRAQAKKNTTAGNHLLAQVEFTKAAGIEQAVIEVATQFNDNFDANRFKAACRPPGFQQPAS